MIQSFDFFGQYELPYMVLKNPNGEELFSLGLSYDIQVSKKFNALSELTFSFPKSIDGGKTTIEAYSYLKNKRLVEVENLGVFVINDSVEENDGTTSIMKVSCKSLEYELVGKRVTAYGGTKKIWDVLDSTGTVLGDMLKLAPNWSVGTVDASLLATYRTFDIADSNVYNVLMNDVETAFECIFFFDTFTRTINVKSIENSTTESDIFFSFDNLIKNISLSEKSDEITTCMAVYGGGNLNIRTVNPLGTDKIYDFSYYATSEWMTAGLISAIDSWKTLVDNNQINYANNLSLLSQYNGEMLSLKSELAELNSEYLTLQGLQKARIQQNLPYNDINAQMEAKQNEIDAKNDAILNKQLQINETTQNLIDINTLVSFENNFTEEQLLELNSFIFENTYKNENIIQTDSMTSVEVQEKAQELYLQGINVLAKVSQPRYEIDIDSSNYIYLQDYSTFTSQTELGVKATIELKDGSYAEVVILEINYEPLDPTSFSIVFSNRLRLDDANFIYSDLMGTVQGIGSTVAFDSLKWSNWENDYKGAVTNFITSALDATTNNLVSNSNQEILINQNGLRARNSDGSGNYSPKQAWLVNNVLAFSDDGFQTSKLALGEVSLPDGGTAYGLVADVIVGRLLAGASLTIANENNSFLVDSSGAYLTNATLNITSTNSKILLDPTNGIKIQALVGGNWVDKFYVDGTGNVNFSGNLSGATGTFSGGITATTGTIGGLIINSQGIQKDSNNYIRSNGDLKWGNLTITGSSATFNGTIFADKIQGQVVDSQVASGLGASKITYGSMSGNRIFGGNATLSGISAVGTSIAVTGGISATAAIVGTLLAGTQLNISGNVLIGGNINVTGGVGLSNTYAVTTPSGTRYMHFSKGILVGFTTTP